MEQEILKTLCKSCHTREDARLMWAARALRFATNTAKTAEVEK